MDDSESIHVTVPGHPGDPPDLPDPPEGVVVHHSPPLHPDDVTVVDGIPVTSVARTLIDLGEVMDKDELRSCFLIARAKGCSIPPSSLGPDRGSSGARRWRWSTS